MKYMLLSLIIALGLSGCSTKEDLVLFNETNVSSENAQNTVTVISDPKFEYRIRPHDRISIMMYNHPELGTTTVASQRVDNRGVLVDSKGYIRLPLVKSIHIAGLTQPVAQAKIEKAYKAYLEDAELSLQVLNKRAYILGEVNNPGEIPLFNEKASLLQVVAQAGDFTDHANRHTIVIMKHRKNTIQTETVDLTGVNSIKLANTMIYPNDMIYVTPNTMKAVNVGINEVTPAFGLASDMLGTAVSIKYLEDN